MPTSFAPDEPNPDDERADRDAESTDAVEYEPPQVESLGTLPDSTGMPASPQQFPPGPVR